MANPSTSRGGPLALTDANLVLGRLVPAHFPKIFGPNEDEGPDEAAAREALKKVKEEVSIWARSLSVGLV